jgi:hypothetical protein
MRLELSNLHRAGSATSSGLLSTWRVGAIVQAVAGRDPGNGQLWLDIGGQRHPARIASGDSAGPRHGETLQLRVLRNSPVLALEEIVSPAAGGIDEGMADALRKYVPRQESPALLLANLAWLAQGKNGLDSLPGAVARAAARLWNALPDTRILNDPAALGTALARSGVFLEAHLAGLWRGTLDADATSDLKALMLLLQRSLQAHGARAAAARVDMPAHSPLPTAQGPLAPLPAAPATFALLDAPGQQLNELARHTDSALARLTTLQLANIMSGTPQSVLIELPVRNDERASIIRLRIERDGSRRTSGGADAWNVEAALDLGASGGLHAKITLAGRRLGVQLRAESPAIVHALSMRSGELESLLREAGLEIDRIVCLHGMPAGDSGTRAARLLNVQA